MANLGKEVFSFRDFTGQVETTSMFVTTATLGTIATDLDTMSNARQVQRRGPSTTADTGASGTNATYPNVEDKAVLVFKGVGGSTHRYSIPAPKAACFLTDGETVDAAAGIVAPVIADILAVACDASGTALVSFSKGFRRRRLSKRG
jgi:hypothetical protein